MHIVKSFNDLLLQVTEIRALKLGFVTNFFPEPTKNGLWIKNEDCFTERTNNTLFIIKQSFSFWSIYYCSTTIETLGKDLDLFIKRYSDRTMMFDLVGHKIQCLPLVELFKSIGCKEATSLVRMARMTDMVNLNTDTSVRYATEQDLPLISKQLHLYFDECTEQIPYDEELLDFMKQRHILLCEENGVTAGFLIFELKATTLYLRYWFTHPDFRNKKVGSKLLRRFFEEGQNTKRQLLWVIRSNENAIVRYRHYGFTEENMFDYVMKYN